MTPDLTIPCEFSHVHSGYHLLKRLLPRIETALVHGLVPLGLDEVELPVVAERAPLRVDDDVLGGLLVLVLLLPQADVAQVLEVAGVGAGAHDQADAALGLLPRT